MSDDWYAAAGQLAEGHPTIHSADDCCALSFANEIAADCDDIQRLPEHGQTPRRYRRVSEVAADD